LAKAEREGSLRERLRFLCRPQLLIVDEIGYLPVVPGGGNRHCGMLCPVSRSDQRSVWILGDRKILSLSMMLVNSRARSAACSSDSITFIPEIWRVRRIEERGSTLG